MRVETMLGIGASSDCQLLVTVVEILLREIEARQPKHLEPNRGSRAIRADDYARSHCDRLTSPLVAQAQRPGFEDDSPTALIEMNGNAARFGFVHHGRIADYAGGRVDDFRCILEVVV